MSSSNSSSKFDSAQHLRSTNASVAATNLAADALAWSELEILVDQLLALATKQTSLNQFYQQLLCLTVKATPLQTGTVWIHPTHSETASSRTFVSQSKGSFSYQPILLSSKNHTQTDTEATRQQHEKILSKAAHTNHACSYPLSDSIQIIAPVHLPNSPPRSSAPLREEMLPKQDQPNGSETSSKKGPGEEKYFTRPAVALLQFTVSSEIAPASLRGLEKLLDTLAKIGTDCHLRYELNQLTENSLFDQQLLLFSQKIHLHLELAPTCYTISNDGKLLIGCDRVTVATLHGSKAKIQSVSGLDRVDPRATTIRLLQELAQHACSYGEPILYDGTFHDIPPQIEETLNAYLDASNVRSIIICPIFQPTDPTQKASDKKPLGALITENFSLSQPSALQFRSAEIASLVTTSLENALTIDRLPFRKPQRVLAWIRSQYLPENQLRTIAILVTLTTFLLALFFIQVEHTVALSATLEPIEQQDFYAPRSGVVTTVFVRHNQLVKANQPLALLYDPTLDLQIKKNVGELTTLTQRLQSLEATRASHRSKKTLEHHQLSSKKIDLQQQISSQRLQLKLLKEEQASLTLRSSLAGRVISWDVQKNLTARPVQQGQRLISIAQVSGDWQIFINVPDSEIKNLKTVSLAAPQPVTFQLMSDNTQQNFTGKITHIDSYLQPITPNQKETQPTVRVTVSFDKTLLSAEQQLLLRPGMTAYAQLQCGRRALGFVWFHEAADHIYRWWTF